MLDFLELVIAMPREFEMQAFAAGAIRVLSGAEMAKAYTGTLIW